MAVTLNASNSGTGGLSVTSDATGNLAFQTAGTTAVTVDTSQKVGIGTTTPARNLHVKAGAVTTLGNSNGALFTDNGNAGVLLGSDNVLGYVSGVTAAGTATVDLVLQPFGGNVMVGSTSPSFTAGSGVKLGLDTTGPAVVCVGAATTASYNSYFIYSTGAGANRFYVSYAGQIYATSTGITAISDVTLKENIRDLETGLNEVMALKPRRFDWKEETKLDQKNVAGFIAQEVEPVLPDLVYDYKYNEETTKKAVKMSDMLPTLVKAIQELKAINDTQAATITALTARIVALEK